MTTLKAVLFDLDDTLIDWSGFDGDYRSVETPRFQRFVDYFEAEGVSLPTVDALLEQYRVAVQQGWEEARETLVPPDMPALFAGVFFDNGIPRESWTDETMDPLHQPGLFPGVVAFPEVPATLQTLLDNQVQIAIVTNAGQPMRLRDHELREAGLLDYFKGCRFAAIDVGVLKPHPHIFEHTLSCLGVSADEAVFVGDSLTADIAGGAKVGMKTVWRDTGYHASRDALDLIAPDATINALDQMLPHLDAWFPGWRGGADRQ